MKNKAKLPFFLFVIYTIISISFSSCSNDLEEINALTQPEKLPNVEVKNLETHYNTDGKTKIKLFAPLALKFAGNKKNYTEFPEGIHVLFIAPNGKVNSELKAKYGIYRDDDRYAKVEGKIELTNVQGTKLETEELYFDEKTEKIYTQKKVKITETNGFTIEGAGGFESNFDFTVYRFTDVSGIIIQEEDVLDEEDDETPDDEFQSNKKQPEYKKNKSDKTIK